MVLKLKIDSSQVSTELVDYRDNNKYIMCDATTSKWGSIDPSCLVRHIGWSQDSQHVSFEFGHPIDADKIPIESQRVYIIGPYKDNEKRLTTFELVHNLHGPSETVLTMPVLSMEDSPNNVLGVVDILVSDDKSKVSFRSSSLDNGNTDNISAQFDITTNFSIPSPLVYEGKYSYITPFNMTSVAIRKLATTEIDSKVSVIDISESDDTSSIDSLTNLQLYNKIKSDLDANTIVLSKMNSSINDIIIKTGLIELYIDKVETEIEAHGRYETLLAMSKQLDDGIKVLKERNTNIDAADINVIRTLSLKSEKLLEDTKLICEATQQSVDRLSTVNVDDNNNQINKDGGKRKDYLSYILLVITSLQLLLGAFKRKEKKRQ